jgi:hypothetical protein
MMKHKSIRRKHSGTNKRSSSSSKRSSSKRSSSKHKRSGHKRSGYKRSSNKHKRSGYKRSSSKRSTKKRSSIKRRLYGGGEVPTYTPSAVTQNSALNRTTEADSEQAAQNSALRGGGIISDIFGAPTGKDCNFDYVAKDAAGYCDVGNVATKNIDTLLQAKEYARYDVPKAM